MHPKRLFVVLARRLVKRHPFTRRRKQRQRSASFWATSAGTFSTSRHAPVNLIFYQKSNQAMCPHFFCASAIALRSASARFASAAARAAARSRSCARRFGPN
jgi:hypothetical protein